MVAIAYAKVEEVEHRTSGGWLAKGVGSTKSTKNCLLEVASLVYDYGSHS